MSISDKVIIIKNIISMICDLLPSVVGLVREVINLLSDIKTV